MTEIVSNLSLNDVRKTMAEMGLETRLSTIEGTEVPCAVASNVSSEFSVYIQDKQSLCFQSKVYRPSPGFSHTCNDWNSSRRFSRVNPIFDGYVMRFAAEISHGVTRENLRALIRTFSESVMEFSDGFTKPLP